MFECYVDVDPRWNNTLKVNWLKGGKELDLTKLTHDQSIDELDENTRFVNILADSGFFFCLFCLFIQRTHSHNLIYIQQQMYMRTYSSDFLRERESMTRRGLIGDPFLMGTTSGEKFILDLVFLVIVLTVP